MTFDEIHDARVALRAKRQAFYKLQDQIHRELETIWKEDDELDIQWNYEWSRKYPDEPLQAVEELHRVDNDGV